ncbi:MAG: hypothetical protein FJY86_03665 [Candidatus Diapherotrites archaeon]|uniref:Uncharacterized protein n=1 Tax=Candidatus Iainarchaeum sp. TaxID=3101447 RepID=A0A8T4CBU6_9ARCH|nr:hypothetical protein [Candidatus Diapherotrites archaeon]
MNQHILMGGLLVLFLLSGCLFGGDATNTAQQLAGVRASYVPTGTLVPSLLVQREAYRNELLPFRNTIRSIVGSEGTALNHYLDGTLELLEMVNHTDEALQLLSNVNLDAPECSANSPISKAIQRIEDARENAQQASDDFAAVQENISMTNALGVDYLQRAEQTARGVSETHAERVKELKIACGFSS